MLFLKLTIIKSFVKSFPNAKVLGRLAREIRCTKLFAVQFHLNLTLKMV